MRFANWPFLFLLILLPALHQWWKHRAKPASVHFPLPLPAQLGLKSPLRILLGLKYAGLIFLILALARPQRGYQQNERIVSGVDIQIILDVSPSMNIEDLAERSRIEVAKDTIESFVKGRQNDRIGLVVFSGEPLTMDPHTLDYGLLLRALTQASTNVLRDGTAIGDGLTLGVSHLRSSKAKSRVIILLTDGDNNLGQVDPATAGELASGYGIRVHTIAIGREGRVKMPIRHKGAFGNMVTTYQWMDNVLNPELLQLISRTTNGKFYRVTDEKALDSVFKEIDQLEKSEVKSREKVKYEEIFQLPLKIGMLLLVIGLLLERGWWRFFP
jgi:Ca-activated chloride channel family protein